MKYGVTAVVRVSEKTYDTQTLEAAGIKTYVNFPSVPSFKYSIEFLSQSLEYPDGSAPDPLVRSKWLSIVKENRNGCIAVHCLHGLGRYDYFHERKILLFTL